MPRAFIPGMGSRVAEGLVIVSDPDGRRSEKTFQPANHYRLMAEAFAEAVLSGQTCPLPARGRRQQHARARRHRRFGGFRKARGDQR